MFSNDCDDEISSGLSDTSKSCRMTLGLSRVCLQGKDQGSEIHLEQA